MSSTKTVSSAKYFINYVVELYRIFVIPCAWPAAQLTITTHPDRNCFNISRSSSAFPKDTLSGDEHVALMSFLLSWTTSISSSISSSSSGTGLVTSRNSEGDVILVTSLNGDDVNISLVYPRSFNNKLRRNIIPDRSSSSASSSPTDQTREHRCPGPLTITTNSGCQNFSF